VISAALESGEIPSCFKRGGNFERKGIVVISHRGFKRLKLMRKGGKHEGEF